VLSEGKRNAHGDEEEKKIGENRTCTIMLLHFSRGWGRRLYKASLITASKKTLDPFPGIGERWDKREVGKKPNRPCSQKNWDKRPVTFANFANADRTKKGGASTAAFDSLVKQKKRKDRFPPGGGDHQKMQNLFRRPWAKERRTSQTTQKDGGKKRSFGT